MFTGIIQDIGDIISVDKNGDWSVVIHAPKLPLKDKAIGASICCSGICLTLIERDTDQFRVQVSMETLSKTTAMQWHQGSRVNLEPALCMGDELGGHLVSGHVDGLAYLMDKRADKDSLRLRFEMPAEQARFVASKGSVTLDGVSLTVNSVFDREFSVNIIPHTQVTTTLGTLEIGMPVNFEVDLFARYLERMTADKS